ncbi:MAG: lipopolysaccharide biosynthesis protein, partial [Capnocytophaga sp.]|nr:lipopolysaccharide biosynthesis protein [Capnocytophaga sp.]
MKIIKKVKFWYYIRSYSLFFFGKRSNPSAKIAKLKASLPPKTLENAQKRVDYYCKITTPISFSGQMYIKNLTKPQTPKAYYFDTYEYARYFDENQPIDFVFGDVIHIPDTPSIVKSRPISDDNQNSVLLNLDKARHFVWV